MTFPPNLRDSRLLELESAIVDFRRRFWIALAGYFILALGVIAAFAVSFYILDEREESAEKVIRFIGRGQYFDCLDRRHLRRGLKAEGIVIAAGKYGDCAEIRERYQRLADDL
jgi:hypothetical protein